jgi:hypothetical protein
MSNETLSTVQDQKDLVESAGVSSGDKVIGEISSQ